MPSTYEQDLHADLTRALDPDEIPAIRYALAKRLKQAAEGMMTCATIAEQHYGDTAEQPVEHLGHTIGYVVASNIGGQYTALDEDHSLVSSGHYTVAAAKQSILSVYGVQAVA